MEDAGTPACRVRLQALAQAPVLETGLDSKTYTPRGQVSHRTPVICRKQRAVNSPDLEPWDAVFVTRERNITGAQPGLNEKH